MKTTKLMLLLVLICTSVASATFTCYFGDEFALADLSVVKTGPIELGVSGGVDYFFDRSSVEDLDIDIAEDYEGVFVKGYLSDGDARPYLCYRPMVKDMRFDSVYHILEAGIEIYSGSDIGVGIAYQHCEEFDNSDKDRLMLTVPYRF